MCRIAAALFLAVALGTRAEAQEVTVALSIYGPFGINDLDGQLPPSVEFRFTVPLSDRFSLEPFATVGSYRNRRSAGLEGFYGAQIRQQIGRFTGKDLQLFASYGAAAYYSSSASSAPFIGHFGLGLRQRLAEHLAVRSDVQLVTFHVVPIGARLVAGVSIGPGS
jgi:hypothetical protein